MIPTNFYHLPLILCAKESHILLHFSNLKFKVEFSNLFDLYKIIFWVVNVKLL